MAPNKITPAKYKNIQQEVIKRYAGEKDAIKKVMPVLQTIRAQIKKQKVNADVVMGGSVAKGTHLKDEYDCDVFIRFDKKTYLNKNISDITQRILTLLKPRRVHGSRDYFLVSDNVEIVPVLKIKSAQELVNVTDASPLHVSWALHAIKKKKMLREEIITTKTFCKAQGVYGAESYIRGFSGHSIDILTMHYGSFLKLATAATKWNKKKVVIDIAKHGTAVDELNTSKTEGPLILIDPIQNNRNAAAALSAEKFLLFSKACRDFLRKPSIDFFEMKKPDIEKLRKLDNSVVLEAESLAGKEDVVGAKLLKVFEYCTQKIQEFSVKESGWHWDKEKKAHFWFICNTDKLPAYFEREGPPVTMKDHAAQFRQKYKQTVTRNGKLFAKVKREKILLIEYAREIVESAYVTEKVESITVVE